MYSTIECIVYLLSLPSPLEEFTAALADLAEITPSLEDWMQSFSQQEDNPQVIMFNLLAFKDVENTQNIEMHSSRACLVNVLLISVLTVHHANTLCKSLVGKKSYYHRRDIRS